MTGRVSDARLHQHSGPEHAFGGFEKVNHGNGTFSMQPTTPSVNLPSFNFSLPSLPNFW